ncbi:MAG: BamA/TamA family outer membrane protein [Ignavibacteria bacterium]|jgi:hypothetical protein|nr:BamA/TamA family outer membrane protein [Ignavibacteria bacterium]
MKAHKFIYIILTLLVCQRLTAEDIIRNIFIDRKEVFEKTDADWFFASPLLNSLHALTKEYIIRDELLFKEDGGLYEDMFLETERNLRATGLFTDIKIELEDAGSGIYDVYVETKDRWSLYPSFIIGASGGQYRLGARLKDYNLLGHGVMLDMDYTYVLRNDTTGYEGTIELEKNRIFRSELNLAVALYKTYLRDGQNMQLSKPFRTLNTSSAYGIFASNDRGNDHFVNKNSYAIRNAIIDTNMLHSLDSMDYNHSSQQKVDVWYAQSWLSGDRVYITGLFEWQQSDRGDAVFDRAYDNQSKLLLAFSSVAQTFYTINNINTFANEDLAIGGWGSVVLGAIFPSNDRGEKGLFYIGAQAEKSWRTNRFYLWTQVTASSSFSSDFAKYTYEEVDVLSYFRFTDRLSLATRIYQQAAWNYPRMRQLMLDDGRGVRGVELQQIAGDNRLVANVELRWFPNLRISVFQFSGVLFYDIGSSWQQRLTDAFFNSKFYSTAGLGIRGHFTKSDNPDHTFRVDIPYNFNSHKFGISLGVGQYFSAFSSHQYKLPAIYGLGYDY